jgi:DNA-binding SARP family transcriptional activator
MASYRQALELYQGDLSPCAGSDTYASVERAHLRSRYLTLLSYLAEYHFKQNDYTTCLHYARLLIRSDPCREDAFRLTMRCYVRCGERAQALRQFELCRHILSTEFNAVPEAATVALFDQIRLNPESV